MFIFLTIFAPMLTKKKMKGKYFDFFLNFFLIWDFFKFLPQFSVQRDKMGVVEMCILLFNNVLFTFVSSFSLSDRL